MKHHDDKTADKPIIYPRKCPICRSGHSEDAMEETLLFLNQHDRTLLREFCCDYLKVTCEDRLRLEGHIDRFLAEKEKP